MLPRNTHTEPCYHMIFNHCVEGVMIINCEGNIVVLNPHASEMMEYEPEELINCSVDKIIPEDFNQKHYALIEKNFNNPVPGPIGRGLRMKAKKKSGVLLLVEISLSPLNTEGTEYIITQVVDISHRVKIEERVEKHIDRIRTNARHLTNMLNAFLSLSKLDVGLKQAVPEEIIITQFTNNVMEEMQTQVKAGQEIKYVHKGNHSAIYQDAKMLRNVLHNLISNAITYAPENKQIYIYPPLKATTSTIEVQDQGIGIPEEDQPHLFTRFFRAHNTSNIQGTGLGLNIVKRYIELMGGSISFTRVANQGTTFFIDLPQNLNKTIS